MLSSHYSGRLNNSINSLDAQAPAKFYEILKYHGFYDVADEDNGLTPEQRASVKPSEQRMYSGLARAIADMVSWYLGNPDNGLATKSMQGIVDKLDVSTSTNSAKIDAMGSALTVSASGGGNPLAANPALALINSIQKLAGSQVAAVMGSSIFDPDIIPPVNFGLNISLPGDIANLYKTGFFQADWNFLYDFEFKSPKFYTTETGGIKIGTGIDVGGAPSELWLKQIFNVTQVSESLTPVGDPVGGISTDDYSLILRARSFGVKGSASTTIDPSVSLDSDQQLKEFSMNDSQMRSAFYKLVNQNLWKPINNRKNWVNGHWGALGHNSCPDYVRTAVASYIWDNGLGLEKNKTDESALISYCLQMGVYYLTGFKYKVKMTGITDTINPKEEDGTPILRTGETKDITGIDRNKNIANTYFTWIADIISRTTHSSSGDEISFKKRKRRIAEANLIYTGLGLEPIVFGMPISELPYAHTAYGLKDRKFNDLVKATVYRYANEGAPGGSGEKHAIKEPQTNQIAIKYGDSVKQDSISNYTKKVLNFLFSAAGIKNLTITSAARNPKEQARVMYENLAAGRRISYQSPGSQVVEIFDRETRRGTDPSTIKRLMEEKIISLFPQIVSRHTVAKPNYLNVVDIAPSSLTPKNKIRLLEEIIKENTGEDKLVSQFLGPRPDMGNDPAYHLVIIQKEGGELQFMNNAMPDVPYTLKNNNNFKSDTAWIAPLSKDSLLKQNYENKG